MSSASEPVRTVLSIGSNGETPFSLSYMLSQASTRNALLRVFDSVAPQELLVNASLETFQLQSMRLIRTPADMDANAILSSMVGKRIAVTYRSRTMVEEQTANASVQRAEGTLISFSLSFSQSMSGAPLATLLLSDNTKPGTDTVQLVNGVDAYNIQLVENDQFFASSTLLITHNSAPPAVLATNSPVNSSYRLKVSGIDRRFRYTIAHVFVVIPHPLTPDSDAVLKIRTQASVVNPYKWAVQVSELHLVEQMRSTEPVVLERAAPVYYSKTTTAPAAMAQARAVPSIQPEESGGGDTSQYQQPLSVGESRGFSSRLIQRDVLLERDQATVVPVGTIANDCKFYALATHTLCTSSDWQDLSMQFVLRARRPSAFLFSGNAHVIMGTRNDTSEGGQLLPLANVAVDAWQKEDELYYDLGQTALVRCAMRMRDGSRQQSERDQKLRMVIELRYYNATQYPLKCKQFLLPNVGRFSELKITQSDFTGTPQPQLRAEFIRERATDYVNHNAYTLVLSLPKAAITNEPVATMALSVTYDL